MAINNKRKMDQVVRIIRQQLSQGVQPQEVESYLIEQGLPQHTAITLIKMNLRPKSQSKPPSPSPELVSEPEQGESKLEFKGKTSQGREKEITIFILEQMAAGKIQSDIVEELVENGIDESEAISLVVKVIGLDS